jgi:catechol 2,3-dioxygenase-like lactoylglutathione lyase family enzyme
MSSGDDQVESIRIRRLSHAAIGVRDLERQTSFYKEQLGLEVVDRSSGACYLRARESHHHVVELLTQQSSGPNHVSFQVGDDAELERAKAILIKQGVRVALGPATDVEPGVRRLLRFKDPEGNMIELVSGVSEISAGYPEKPVKPLSLNHIVLFAGDLAKQQSFYETILGMGVTDTVPGLMTFLRFNSNHHSFGFIALPQRGRQHAAFDFQERSEFSEAIIQLGDAGFRRLDGPGRHGPGNMLFAYFEDPEKNLLEFCTEIQQVDEATHRPKAWDVDSALDTWRSPKGMGPPKGFRWVLPFAGQISKMSRKLLPG